MLPTKEELSQLSGLVARLLARQEEVELQEKLLESAKDALRQVQEVAIPEMMSEIGMREFELKNGMKLTIKEDIYASIRKDFINDAVKWLDDNGLGDIVKDKVEVQFARGESEKAKELMSFCSKNRFTAAETLSVHPQTLKATIKEQMARGEEFPEEFFSIAPVRKAIVKK